MLTVCIGSEGGEDLELSSSEDEREKEERQRGERHRERRRRGRMEQGQPREERQRRCPERLGEREVPAAAEGTLPPSAAAENVGGQREAPVERHARSSDRRRGVWARERENRGRGGEEARRRPRRRRGRQGRRRRRIP